MTLSRRILLKNSLLVLGMLLLAGVSLFGLYGLRDDVRVAVTEYEEMKTIEGVQADVAAAIGGLRMPKPDLATVRSELMARRDELHRFVQHRDPDDEDMAHETREISNGDAALSRLDDAIARINAQPPDVTGAVTLLHETSESLGHVAEECNATVRQMHHDSQHDLHRIIRVVAALAIATVALAVVVSISQYRHVMAPLRKLREAVRAMAGGHFEQTITPAGDEEFVALADDFNRMASELDHFYRRLEEMVAEKSRELVQSERLASVGFLAAGVAHEINNPLNVISGQAELSIKRLEDGSDDNARIAKKLHIIREEAFRCKEITQKLLSLARKGDDTREPVSLHRAADEVAFMAAAIPGYRDRAVDVRIDPSEPLNVIANSNEMKQVLLNLVINALEAVDAGTGRVSIEGALDGDWVELSVSDNGRGMSDETLRKVFEPFYTDKRGASAPGTGLGLSITHAIIEQHGGRIAASSDGPGRGSRFVIRLPAATGESTASRTIGSAIVQAGVEQEAV